MLPVASPTRTAAVMTSRRPHTDATVDATRVTTAQRPAPSLLTIALVSLNVAALAIGPLVLVRPVPASAEDLARLTGLLVVLTVLGAVFALTRAGVLARVLISALLAGTAATAAHVAAYTVLGTAGRSPADFWSLGAAAVAGIVVALWLVRCILPGLSDLSGLSGLSARVPSSGVLGGLAVANGVAAAVLGAVFLGG